MGLGVVFAAAVGLSVPNLRQARRDRASLGWAPPPERWTVANRVLIAWCRLIEAAALAAITIVYALARGRAREIAILVTAAVIAACTIIIRLGERSTSRRIRTYALAEANAWPPPPPPPTRSSGPSGP